MDLINCNNKVQDAKNHDAYAFLEKIFGSYIWELKYTSNTGLIHIERLYFDKKKFIVNKSVLSTTNNNVIKLIYPYFLGGIKFYIIKIRIHYL